MNKENVIAIYNDLFIKAWHKMVSIVGIHTVMVLVQRSLWQTRQKYAEAELISVSEAGVSFDVLDGIETEQLKKIMEDLFASLIDILTRLLGEEITRKIAEDIDGFVNEREVV